jgi:predicted peptidase
MARFCTTALFIFFSVVAALSYDTGFLNRTIKIGRETYRYQVFVPADWNNSRKWPVILFLHGSGERGNDGLKQTDVGLGHAVRVNPAGFPFVIVMPQCRDGKIWSDTEMQAMALAALERSAQEFHGDPHRVYLVGLSMGGYGAWAYAAQMPGKFAALVVVCGGLKGPSFFPELHVPMMDDRRIVDPYTETARRVGKSPAWIFHGAADDTIPVEESRKMVAALKISGGEFKYTEYPGVGHNSWDRAFAEPDLFPWLQKQSLRH